MYAGGGERRNQEAPVAQASLLFVFAYRVEWLSTNLFPICKHPPNRRPVSQFFVCT